MRGLVFLSLLLSLVLGLWKAAEGCCPPSQLEFSAVGKGLMLTEHGGDPYSGYSQIYHDEKKGKYVKDVKVTFEKTGPMTLFVLEDYAGGKLYTVLNGSCSVEPLKGDFNQEHCMNQSNFQGNITVGLDPYSNTMSLYSLNYSNPKYDIYGEAEVLPISDERCLLQSEMIIARQQSKLVAMESAFLFNASASISNPAIFDIPKECKTACASQLNTRFASSFGAYIHGLKIRI